MSKTKSAPATTPNGQPDSPVPDALPAPAPLKKKKSPPIPTLQLAARLRRMLMKASPKQRKWAIAFLGSEFDENGEPHDLFTTEPETVS